MRVNKGLLGWGVFLIVLGLEALAIRSGQLDANLARRALEVWPLILVAFGINLVLQRTWAAALGTIAVALVFALMAGALIATTPIAGRGSSICGAVTAGADGTGGGPSSNANAGTLGPEASVTIVADCGTVRIGGTNGSDYKLWWGNDDRLAPNVAASASSLTLRRQTGVGVNVGSPAIDWTIALPRDPVLGLDLQMSAGSMTAQLGGLRIPKLGASVNAGEAKINLSEARDTRSINGTANAGSLSIVLPDPTGTLTGSLDVNAGTIRVCVPASAGLRIRVEGEALATNNFAGRGLTNSGDTWTRTGWDTATSRIDLVVSANLGTVMLDPEEGCG